MIKPSLAKGTRDFSPQEVYRRRFISDAIRKVFEKYGYQPIETPTMENLSTLEGKYGDEGDQLLFRILNSGDAFKDVSVDDLQKKTARAKVTEKGLRYDLTVPFARYVVMHQNEISFPFKRYQMQNVFRADRPQRGRYREFMQCDADVVGSNSLLNEMELINIYDEVFQTLNIPVCIKLNNRKILSGMAASIGAADKFAEITVTIDKLDKVGLQGVRQELVNKGLTESQIQVIEKFFAAAGNNQNKLAVATQLLSDNAEGMKGIEELNMVLNLLEAGRKVNSPVEIDFTLARGLNYYTGAIIEVKPTTVQMGSVGGGGRYDDLTGMFGLKDVSGVGISFGLDRMYDVMAELNLFENTNANSTQVLITNFDEAAQQFALPLAAQLRESGIATEIYHQHDKLKKQMKYADDKKIPFVILIGENELKENKVTLKNMVSGEQKLIEAGEVISYLTTESQRH